MQIMAHVKAKLHQQKALHAQLAVSPTQSCMLHALFAECPCVEGSHAAVNAAFLLRFSLSCSP